jgi:hypothetical protein
MPLTVNDLLTSVRDQLQDTRLLDGSGFAVAPRHSDEKLIRYLNLGLADARRIRPDLFLPSLETDPPLYTTADLATPFVLEYAWSVPFIEYIVGMVSLEEDEYVAEGRAAAMLQRFALKMIGKVG